VTPCREALPLLNDDTVYSKGLLSLDLKVRDTNSLLAAALGISGLSCVTSVTYNYSGNAAQTRTFNAWPD
jgi:hypothetical protein